MKQETSMIKITRRFNKIYYCGYADLYYIFYGEEPQYYNAGVYGWNCDIYCSYWEGWAITTGYRNTRGARIPSKLIDKYTKAGKRILEKNYKYQKARENALDKNRKNFIKELTGGLRK